MSSAAALSWFARHELRLAWREWLAMMTGGRRRRTRAAVIGLIAFAVLLHLPAWAVIGRFADLRLPLDKSELIVISATIVLAWSLMLSQAIESVTRAFYARGDLELILTSPASASRLFAVRIAAMVVTTLAMALVLGAPFINILAWLGGACWLGAYAVALALAMDAVAIAVAITIALFHAIGPRRTRFVAQILAAVVGAAFAIGVQFAAILSYGTNADPRPALLSGFAPGRDSAILLPARAVVGEPAALLAMLGIGIAALAVAIHTFAPQFGRQALAAATSQSTRQRRRRQSPFRVASPAQALRRKE